MSNKHIGNSLQIIGWLIIIVNIGFLQPLFMITYGASIIWIELLTYLLSYLPNIIGGILLVWLGQRINKNVIEPDKDQSKINNKSIGKSTKFFGWIVVLLASIYSVFGYISTNSDASGSVYAPLILFSGGIFVVAGLIIVWIGNRIQKNTNQAKTEESNT